MAKRLCAALVMMGVVIATAGRAEAGLVVYATESGGGTSTFGTLNLTDGQFTAISNLSVTVVGLTYGNGTLYGSAESGSLYTISGGVATQFGTISGPDFFGLAFAGSSGFYGADATTEFLDKIAPDGNSFTTIGTLPTIAGSGSLSMSFGPNGSLYYTGLDGSGNVALFGINPSTGVATEIGSGLGSLGNDPLTLVNAGGQLYGIDTAVGGGIGPINIYTINTTTGLATATGVTVTGLTAGFTLDTAAAVPEPSSLVLCGIAGVLGLVVARGRCRLAA